MRLPPIPIQSNCVMAKWPGLSPLPEGRTTPLRNLRSLCRRRYFPGADTFWNGYDPFIDYSTGARCQQVRDLIRHGPEVREV